ncbi:hypothetical protein [Streptomyces melanogenes]|uniref:hypothetical protein n=1 Tax=Streptomyces melanogenes TaxID=67326 RepID=UPI00167E4F8E|nr:hypothetical protein [Streptomyces melanogenes]GGP93567.1 hypothetical protein GCM10010278_84570 [Streptomyces melanogenes]
MRSRVLGGGLAVDVVVLLVVLAVLAVEFLDFLDRPIAGAREDERTNPTRGPRAYWGQ